METQHAHSYGCRPMRIGNDSNNVADDVIAAINNSSCVDDGPVKGCLELEKKYGTVVYSDIIYKLTRLHISPELAKQYWADIISHMKNLSKALDRNVGIHLAMCDYFSNINNYIKKPVLIEERILEHKEESAYRDGLTGLFNRRYFNQEMPTEIERFRRFGIPFSLLMLDLDHFKKFNDTYGHQAGDMALKVVADVISQSARIYDKTVRYGGEEFAVIMPQSCRTEALVAAERIRAAVEEHPLIYDGEDLEAITVSIGIATYPIDALEMVGLVRRADQALYVAKRRRNAVVAYCDYNRRGPRYSQERSMTV